MNRPVTVREWQRSQPRTAKETAALRRIRAKAEKAVDRLLALLDDIAADPDLEENGDDEPALGYTGMEAAYGARANGAASEEEPSLGWTGVINQASRNRLGAGHDSERDTADHEPSLGALEQHPSLYGPERSHVGEQTYWARSSTSDAEDEHDGAEPGEDEEPSLGWTDMEARYGCKPPGFVVDAEREHDGREEDDPGEQEPDREPEDDGNICPDDPAYQSRLRARRRASRSQPDAESSYVGMTITGPDGKAYRITTVS